jgi:hypothetical protein
MILQKIGDYFSCYLLDSSMLVDIRDLWDFPRKQPEYLYTAPKVGLFPDAVWPTVS